MLIPLFPVSPPPSIVPPEMDILVCPVAEVETAELAPVDELI